jgi:hypothetical protein
LRAFIKTLNPVYNKVGKKAALKTLTPLTPDIEEVPVGI